MTKKYEIASLFVLALLAGCAVPMQAVVENCDATNRAYPEISNCIKNTYIAKGGNVNSIAVKSFFASLNVIDDEYKTHQISDDQAKVKMYQAYSKTIQVELDREQSSQPVVCMPMPFNRMVICQ